MRDLESGFIGLLLLLGVAGLLLGGGIYVYTQTYSKAELRTATSTAPTATSATSTQDDRGPQPKDIDTPAKLPDPKVTNVGGKYEIYALGPGYVTPEALAEFKKTQKTCIGRSEPIPADPRLADAPLLAKCYGYLALTSETKKPACIRGGCSGQLCVEERADGDGLATTCEYRAEYACYQTAACERQSSGSCGWTQTPTLAACLTTKEYTIKEEYSTTVTVGGVVGIEKVTYHVGDTIKGREVTGGIEIELRAHSELNEGAPGPWSYQETLIIPREYIE